MHVTTPCTASTETRGRHNSQSQRLKEQTVWLRERARSLLGPRVTGHSQGRQAQNLIPKFTKTRLLYQSLRTSKPMRASD